MAALTVKQSNEIAKILSSLEKGVNFIRDDRTGVVMLCNYPATARSDYSSSDGKTSAALLEKSYGSELCGLYKALRALKAFRDAHQTQREAL